MNKNRYIPRRKFFRGLGTIIALPMLEAMAPSLSTFAQTVSQTQRGFPKRLAFVYVPNGKNMEDWTPKAAGETFDLPMIFPCSSRVAVAAVSRRDAI